MTIEQITEKKYGDILDREAPIPLRHTRMDLQDRAAQFSPFAALVGYDDCIRETARLTDEQMELDENVKASLDERFAYLCAKQKEEPEITITFFVPDALKEGGEYRRVTGRVRKIDLYAGNLFLADGQIIPLQMVTELCGDFFRELED